MADPAARRPPPLRPSRPVRLLPPLARFALRGAREVMERASTAIEVAITEQACRSARSAERAALWLGPDEQLILTALDDGPIVARRLSDALAGTRHSLVDVGHRQLALEVSGPSATVALSVGCPLDLDAEAFPVGMCTRTLLGKADIVLWRTGIQTFHIEVWRSFADYATRFLAQAALELAC